MKDTLKGVSAKLGASLALIVALYLLLPLVCAVAPVHLGKSYVMILMPREWGFGRYDVWFPMDGQKVLLSHDMKCGYFAIVTDGPNSEISSSYY